MLDPCRNWVSSILGVIREDRPTIDEMDRAESEISAHTAELMKKLAEKADYGDRIQQLRDAVEKYAKAPTDELKAEAGAEIKLIFEAIASDPVSETEMGEWLTALGKSMGWPDDLLRGLRKRQSSSLLYTLYRAAGFGYLFGAPTGWPFLFLMGKGVSNFIREWTFEENKRGIWAEFEAMMHDHGLAWLNEEGELDLPEGFDREKKVFGGGGPGGGGGGGVMGGGGGGYVGGGVIDRLRSGVSIELPEALKVAGRKAQPVAVGAAKGTMRDAFMEHYNDLHKALTP